MPFHQHVGRLQIEVKNGRLVRMEVQYALLARKSKWKTGQEVMPSANKWYELQGTQPQKGMSNRACSHIR